MNTQKAQLNADFSNKAYHTYTQQDVDNHTSFKGTDGQTWEVYAVSGNTQAPNGFYGVAFKNPETHEVVVAYRGSDDGRDVWTDIQIGRGKCRDTLGKCR